MANKVRPSRPTQTKPPSSTPAASRGRNAPRKRNPSSTTPSTTTAPSGPKGRNDTSRLRRNSPDSTSISPEATSEEKPRSGFGAFLDGLQGGLDAAGLLPGVGIVPDLANSAVSGLRYLATGDNSHAVNAGLSLGAAVPIVGQGVTGAKYAAKAAKALDAVPTGKIAKADVPSVPKPDVPSTPKPDAPGAPKPDGPNGPRSETPAKKPEKPDNADKPDAPGRIPGSELPTEFDQSFGHGWKKHGPPGTEGVDHEKHLRKLDEKGKPGQSFTWFKSKDEIDAAVAAAPSRLQDALKNNPELKKQYEDWIAKPKEGDSFGFSFPNDLGVGAGTKKGVGDLSANDLGRIRVDYAWTKKGDSFVPKVKTIYPGELPK